MPASRAGWSMKAKAQSRRARVADAAGKDYPEGGFRRPRPLVSRGENAATPGRENAAREC